MDPDASMDLPPRWAANFSRASGDTLATIVLRATDQTTQGDDHDPADPPPVRIDAERPRAAALLSAVPGRHLPRRTAARRRQLDGAVHLLQQGTGDERGTRVPVPA